jgi:peroxiredoxin
VNPKKAAIASAVAIMLGGCGGSQDSGGVSTAGTSAPAGGVATGASASDFTARDTDGKTVKLSSYLGKQAILLDFCATWCEPCVAEFPHLRKMYSANKDKGFVVLAIAMDGPDTVAAVPAFAKRNQLDFPMLTDEDSHIASIYNPKKAAPLSVLIDRQGRVVAIREGYNPGDEEFLAQDVAKVLDASGGPK